MSARSEGVRLYIRRMDSTSASKGLESGVRSEGGKYSRRFARREGVSVSEGRAVEVAMAMARTDVG